jgi:hypothetical protein
VCDISTNQLPGIHVLRFTSEHYFSPGSRCANPSYPFSGSMEYIITHPEEFNELVIRAAEVSLKSEQHD